MDPAISDTIFFIPALRVTAKKTFYGPNPFTKLLQLIYTSNFRAHDQIKLVYFKEEKIIVCLANLQA